MEFSMQKLIRTMDNMGFAESTVGTKYIREAVEYAAELDRIMMTKDIYPAVAALHGESSTAVERAIRTAIAKALRSPWGEEAWRRLGGCCEPTNSEVIMRLLRECEYED